MELSINFLRKEHVAKLCEPPSEAIPLMRKLFSGNGFYKQ